MHQTVSSESIRIEASQCNNALNLIATHWNPPFSFDFINATFILQVRELLKQMSIRGTKVCGNTSLTAQTK
jgi:hypothetical protein